MVVGNVAEYAAAEMQTSYPVLMHSMRACFHEHMRATIVNHLFQQGIKTYCIRCGMGCRNNFIAYMILYSA